MSELFCFHSTQTRNPEGMSKFAPVPFIVFIVVHHREWATQTCWNAGKQRPEIVRGFLQGPTRQFVERIPISGGFLSWLSERPIVLSRIWFTSSIIEDFAISPDDQTLLAHAFKAIGFCFFSGDATSSWEISFSENYAFMFLYLLRAENRFPMRLKQFGLVNLWIAESVSARSDQKKRLGLDWLLIWRDVTMSNWKPSIPIGHTLSSMKTVLEPTAISFDLVEIHLSQQLLKRNDDEAYEYLWKKSSLSLTRFGSRWFLLW
jgi:hypothetical protein